VRPYKRPAPEKLAASEMPAREEESPATSLPTEANLPARARGPRIAQVRMLKPQSQTT